MEVGLVGNTLNFSWLKYLSVVRVGEEICLAKYTFSGHEMTTQYYTIKIQIMAFGRSGVSTANREGSPLDHSVQPPPYLSGGRVGGRVHALVRHCPRFVWSKFFHRAP